MIYNFLKFYLQKLCAKWTTYHQNKNPQNHLRFQKFKPSKITTLMLLSEQKSDMSVRTQTDIHFIAPAYSDTKQLYMFTASTG